MPRRRPFFPRPDRSASRAGSSTWPATRWLAVFDLAKRGDDRGGGAIQEETRGPPPRGQPRRPPHALFRIGVHLGEIIEKGGTGRSTGDRPSNVAAAHPGGWPSPVACGACPTRSIAWCANPASRSTGGMAGEHTVKNIARDRSGSGAGRPAPAPDAAPGRHARAAGPQARRGPPPCPRRPSIAGCWRSRTCPGEPGSRSTSPNGINRGHHPSPICRSTRGFPSSSLRNSSFTLQGSGGRRDASSGASLGVRYGPSEGSRSPRPARRVRITAPARRRNQRAAHLWAEKYDRDPDRPVRHAGRDHARDRPGSLAPQDAGYRDAARPAQGSAGPWMPGSSRFRAAGWHPRPAHPGRTNVEGAAPGPLGVDPP